MRFIDVFDQLNRGDDHRKCDGLAVTLLNTSKTNGSMFVKVVDSVFNPADKSGARVQADIGELSDQASQRVTHLRIPTTKLLSRLGATQPHWQNIEHPTGIFRISAKVNGRDFSVFSRVGMEPLGDPKGLSTPQEHRG